MSSNHPVHGITIPLALHGNPVTGTLFSNDQSDPGRSKKRSLTYKTDIGENMTTRTVFVIGAGASKEVNLPTGYELKRNIASLLDFRFGNFKAFEGGDNIIITAIKRYVQGLVNEDGVQEGGLDYYIDQALHIRDALPQAISIDNFLDSQKGNDALALCGKLSIVRSILLSEKQSLLYFKHDRQGATINFELIEDKWFIPFFQIITENCTKADLSDRFKSISLIIFNYDRCIEHFLVHALCNYYRITEQDAAQLIRYINIYHPYGKVGDLPWQVRHHYTDFGAEPDANQLLDLAQSIKTFTEGTNPNSSDIVQIRERIYNAEKLVFLGFAFHKLNMELLAPQKTKPKSMQGFRCFATAFGISNSDREVVYELIRSLYNLRDFSYNFACLTCNDFFKEFSRSLSF